MSLRFRISDRSRLGRRLRGLDEAARKEVFDRVVEIGLAAVDGDDQGTLHDRLNRSLMMLETLDARTAMLHTRLEEISHALEGARFSPAGTLRSLVRADVAVSKDELHTLMRTLDGLGTCRPLAGQAQSAG
jgi:hypothetical protein